MHWIRGNVRGFPVGLALGVTFAVVALGLFGATRRRRARARALDPKRRLIIDGAKPEDPVALSVRPGEEANSPSSRLESESAVDIFTTHERW